MKKREVPDEIVFSKKVYDFLRKKIINKDYKPGEPILELSVSKELGVSRTPIREALKLLQQENLVTVYPRRGAFVTSISLDNIREIFQIRQIIEPEVAFLVAPYIAEKQVSQLEQKLLSIKKNFDETKDVDVQKAVKAGWELHDLILSTLGNRTLIQVFEQLSLEINRGCDFVGSRRAGNISKHLEQHIEIASALKKRKAEEAKNLVDKHIKDARDDLLG